MRRSAKAWCGRLRHARATVAPGALALLVALGIVLPAGAPAGQSSQATPEPVAQVAAGLFHSCALVDDGTPPAAGRPVRCWGFSGNGQVGYGNTNVIGDDEVPASVGPIDLGAGRTAKALAAGDYHTCAVLDDGGVRCWGYGNEGQLGYGSRGHIGDNETPGSVGPVNLGAGRTASAITAGGNHTCAILDDGNVRCWGLGEFGQLGYGGTASIGDGEDPGLVGPVNLDGHTATAITAGLGHTCAILDDGDVRCWGIGVNGQLGYGTTSAVLDPGVVGSVGLGQDRTAKAITAGASHTCAILDDGSVRCWGLNDHGQLGLGNKISIGDNEAPGSVAPVDLGAGRTATAISAGGEHACAALDNGALRCWGAGFYGQLGYASLNDVGDDERPGEVAPVDLGPGSRAKAVAAGIYHTCARLDDASVRCWGNGADGRLGLCRSADVGDDETPASVERVDIGFGGAACPAAPPPPPPPPSSPAGPAATPPPPPPPPPAAATPDDTQEALRLQRIRAQDLADCRAAVIRQARRGRSSAMRRYRRDRHTRALALAQIQRRAARGRASCLRRFGRVPGRVTTLAAKTGARGKVVLTFRAPGSDGSSPPAARSYVVKQSLRPIRTRAQYDRAHALCMGGCTFDVLRLRATITLTVADLRPKTTYYYSVAARDNVSKRIGPRSTTVHARAG